MLLPLATLLLGALKQVTSHGAWSLQCCCWFISQFRNCHWRQACAIGSGFMVVGQCPSCHKLDGRNGNGIFFQHWFYWGAGWTKQYWQGNLRTQDLQLEGSFWVQEGTHSLLTLSLCCFPGAFYKVGSETNITQTSSGLIPALCQLQCCEEARDSALTGRCILQVSQQQQQNQHQTQRDYFGSFSQHFNNNCPLIMHLKYFLSWISGLFLFFFK